MTGLDTHSQPVIIIVWLLLLLLRSALRFGLKLDGAAGSLLGEGSGDLFFSVFCFLGELPCKGAVVSSSCSRSSASGRQSTGDSAR